MTRLLFILAAFVGFAIAAVAHAESGDLPGTLGCFDQDRQHCGRVLVPTALTGFSLLRRQVVLGAFPEGGFGAGVDFWAKRWYTLTPGMAVTASAVNGSFLNIAWLVGLCKYGWLGVSAHVEPAFSEWFALGGVDPLALAHLIGR